MAPSKRYPVEPRRRASLRGRRERGGGNSPSDDSSDSSEEEAEQSRARAEARKKKTRKTTKEKEISETTLKNIKTIRAMLALYTKASKTPIQDHAAMYVRLMEALHFNTDEQMVKYFSWTFGSDSQAFFLTRDINDFSCWDEYKREVIKHFSPRRNKQEALQYALGLTCAEDQNPREFLQNLKHAFGQAYKTVQTEGAEFRSTFFYGLPPNMRMQMARDFNERRSVRWILEQAVNIFEVSGVSAAPIVREPPKAKASNPSKVLEVTKEQNLPLEAGKNQGNKNDTLKEKKTPPKQKETAASGVSGTQTPSPTVEPRPFYVSAKYKGNRPQENYVYQSKAQRQTGSNPNSDEDANLRRNTSREENGGAQERRNSAREQYEGSQEQRSYSPPNSYRQYPSREQYEGGQEQRSYSPPNSYRQHQSRETYGDNQGQRSYSSNNSYRPYPPRERSPERYSRTVPDQRHFESLEQQMKEMREAMNRLTSEGRGSRPSTPSGTQSTSEQNQE